MRGKPKYKLGDDVIFSFNEKKLSGKVYIVDPYGTFEDNSDVSYDILVDAESYKREFNGEGACLFKHINEKYVNEAN